MAGINLLMGNDQSTPPPEEQRVDPRMIPPKSINERHLKDSVLKNYAKTTDLSGLTTTTAMTAAISAAIVPVTASIALVPHVKVLTFSRDMTAASGSVTYTGLNFTPKLLIVTGSFTGGTIKSTSDGCTDGTTTSCKSIDNAGNASFTGELLVAWDTYATKNQFATLSSFNSTGFVWNWTKSGSPSAGTFYFMVTCIG